MGEADRDRFCRVTPTFTLTLTFTFTVGLILTRERSRVSVRYATSSQELSSPGDRAGNATRLQPEMRPHWHSSGGEGAVRLQ